MSLKSPPVVVTAWAITLASLIAVITAIVALRKARKNRED